MCKARKFFLVFFTFLLLSVSLISVFADSVSPINVLRLPDTLTVQYFSGNKTYSMNLTYDRPNGSFGKQYSPDEPGGSSVTSMRFVFESLAGASSNQSFCIDFHGLCNRISGSGIVFRPGQYDVFAQSSSFSTDLLVGTMTVASDYSFDVHIDFQTPTTLSYFSFFVNVETIGNLSMDFNVSFESVSSYYVGDPQFKPQYDPVDTSDLNEYEGLESDLIGDSQAGIDDYEDAVGNIEMNVSMFTSALLGLKNMFNALISVGWLNSLLYVSLALGSLAFLIGLLSTMRRHK